jgi:uncharacterized protein YukE
MDQARSPERPTLHANIETLLRELEQLHRTARSAASERREADDRGSGGIVIRGK